MNPRTSVGHGPSDGPLGIEVLPPIPRWLRLAAGVGLLVAGVLSLVGTLRGGL